MSGIQSVCLMLLLVGTVLNICCVTLPYWKVNDPEDTIRDNIYRVSIDLCLWEISKTLNCDLIT